MDRESRNWFRYAKCIIDAGTEVLQSYLNLHPSICSFSDYRFIWLILVKDYCRSYNLRELWTLLNQQCSALDITSQQIIQPLFSKWKCSIVGTPTEIRQDMFAMENWKTDLQDILSKTAIQQDTLSRLSNEVHKLMTEHYFFLTLKRNWTNDCIHLCHTEQLDKLHWIEQHNEWTTSLMSAFLQKLDGDLEYTLKTCQQDVGIYSYELKTKLQTSFIFWQLMIDKCIDSWAINIPDCLNQKILQSLLTDVRNDLPVVHYICQGKVNDIYSTTHNILQRLAKWNHQLEQVGEPTGDLQDFAREWHEKLQALTSVFELQTRDFFDSKRADLQRLRERYTLTEPQWSLMFPYQRNINLQTFAITLLYILTGNICPVFQPESGWSVEILDTYHSIGKDLLRPNNYSNDYVGHIPHRTLSNSDFKKIWDILATILYKLSLPLENEFCRKQEILQKITELTCSFDDNAEIKLELDHINWCKSNICRTEEQLESCLGHLQALNEKVQDLPQEPVILLSEIQHVWTQTGHMNGDLPLARAFRSQAMGNESMNWFRFERLLVGTEVLKKFHASTCRLSGYHDVCLIKVKDYCRSYDLKVLGTLLNQQESAIYATSQQIIHPLLSKWKCSIVGTPMEIRQQTFALESCKSDLQDALCKTAIQQDILSKLSNEIRKRATEHFLLLTSVNNRTKNCVHLTHINQLDLLHWIEEHDENRTSLLRTFATFLQKLDAVMGQGTGDLQNTLKTCQQDEGNYSYELKKNLQTSFISWQSNSNKCIDLWARNIPNCLNQNILQSLLTDVRNELPVVHYTCQREVNVFCSTWRNNILTKWNHQLQQLIESTWALHDLAMKCPEKLQDFPSVSELQTKYFFDSMRADLQRLKAQCTLTEPHWSLMFPSQLYVILPTFAITLWYTLLRNICPVFPPESGWSVEILNTDHSMGEVLLRLKNYRNGYVGHIPHRALSNSDFNNIWNILATILYRLSLSLGNEFWQEIQQKITELRTCSFDDRAEIKLELELINWCRRDICRMEEKLESCLGHLQALNEKVQDLPQQRVILLSEMQHVWTQIGNMNGDLFPIREKNSNIHYLSTGNFDISYNANTRDAKQKIIYIERKVPKEEVNIKNSNHGIVVEEGMKAKDENKSIIPNMEKETLASIDRDVESKLSSTGERIVPEQSDMKKKSTGHQRGRKRSMNTICDDTDNEILISENGRKDEDPSLDYNHIPKRTTRLRIILFNTNFQSAASHNKNKESSVAEEVAANQCRNNYGMDKSAEEEMGIIEVEEESQTTNDGDRVRLLYTNHVTAKLPSPLVHSVFLVELRIENFRSVIMTHILAAYDLLIKLCRLENEYIRCQLDTELIQYLEEDEVKLLPLKTRINLQSTATASKKLTLKYKNKSSNVVDTIQLEDFVHASVKAFFKASNITFDPREDVNTNEQQIQSYVDPLAQQEKNSDEFYKSYVRDIDLKEKKRCNLHHRILLAYDQLPLPCLSRDAIVGFVVGQTRDTTPAEHEDLKEILTQLASDNIPGPQITMKYEMLRLCTMKSFPGGEKPFAIRIVGAGFYYAGYQDQVICYCCGNRKDNWVLGDIPLLIHQKMAPSCTFLTNNGAVSIPIRRANSAGSPAEVRLLAIQRFAGANQSDTAQGESSLMLPSGEQSQVNISSGTLQILVTNKSSPPNNFMSSGEQNVLDNRHTSVAIADSVKEPPPKYPQYAVKNMRINSFLGWPSELHQRPEEMAECGFYYAGFSDCVRCFYCGVGLRHWMSEDDPWIEHARWSTSCVYVYKMKGGEFVSLVKMAVEIAEREEAARGNGVANHPPQNNTKAAPAEEDSHSNTAINSTAPRDSTSSMRVTGGAAGGATASTPSSGNAEIQKYLLTDAAQSVLDMGYQPKMVQRAIERVLMKKGTEELTGLIIMEAVFEIEEEEKTKHKPQPPSQLAETNGSDAKANDKDKTKDKQDRKQDGDTGEVEGASGEETQIDVEKIRREHRELSEATLCKICLDNTISVVFLPCGHLVTCPDCAPAMRKCPICRALIKGTVKTFYG